MKTYYLRFNSSDLANVSIDLDGNTVWTSGIIDLYNNTRYKNYSATKSLYGINSLGDNTWTGFRQINSTTTDAGIIDNGRFVDYTGRIDLYSWSFTASSLYLDTVSPTLTVYNTDNPSAIFPSEWATKTNISITDPLFIVDAERYLRISLAFPPDLNTAGLTVEVSLQVDIEKPVMSPMYQSTRRMLDKYPEWMAIREYRNAPSATPTLEVPQSVGGKFLNAISGEWIDEVLQQVNYSDLQRFLTTADSSQKTWAYRIVDVPGSLDSVVGDGVQLGRTADQKEFQESSSTSNFFWWNRGSNSIYLNKHYTVLLVNGVDVSDRQASFHIWNWFDDIGFSVDLYRLPGEDNEIFRKRILDVYKNKPGVGTEAFKRALRREFNLWLYADATPNSDSTVGLPDILEIDDLRNDLTYWDEDGYPGEKFLSLVSELAKNYPTTWGNFEWNKAYWDVGGIDPLTEKDNYGAIPRRLDATPPTDDFYEVGVGDINDLYVYKPDQYTGPRTFNAKFKLRGKQRISRLEYPAVDFDILFKGRGIKTIYRNPALTMWFTLTLNLGGAGNYYTTFQMSGTSDIDAVILDTTTSHYTNFTWMTEHGDYTDPSIIWRKTTDNSVYGGATPTQIATSIISSVTLTQGTWDVGTTAFTNVDATNALNYYAWLARYPASVLHGATSAQTIATFSTQPYKTDVVFKSVKTATVSDYWYSTPQSYHVTLNGSLPDNSQQNFTLPIPTVVWDSGASSREYVVEIITSNGSSRGGVYSVNNATPSFLPSAYIQLNGSGGWNVAGVQTFSISGVTNLVFSTSGGPFPIQASVWSFFEAAQTSALVQGIVDENGPWREGQPQIYGSANYIFDQVTLTRNDFGIPNTSDYVPSWLGVEIVGDTNVIAWIDVNTVKPAVYDDSNIQYPDNAVKESYLGGIFTLDPVNLKVRLRPGINEQWNPKVNSGWFYQDHNEYYMFANKGAASLTGSTPSLVLPALARQGAPIIVTDSAATPVMFRRVAFMLDSGTPSIDEATPSMSLTFTQVVGGTDSTRLYAAYDNIYNVSIIDLNTGLPITPLSTTSASNIVNTNVQTKMEHQYKLTYRLRNSFYADNDYIYSDNTQRTKLVFDTTPGSKTFKVNYETSVFDPATPVDLALNPMFTSLDEGFIFIDDNTATLSSVEVRLSPGQIVADGLDYMLISLRSLDNYGNPKGFQTFTLTTTFGTLSATTITTDVDGFATCTLVSSLYAATPISSGQIKIVGQNINSTVQFGVVPVLPKSYRLTAIPSVSEIPADGRSLIYVIGRLETADFTPVPFTNVHWRKARYLYDLFNMPYANFGATPKQTGAKGFVVTDSQGRFTIGPFQAATPMSPGYWLVAAEAGVKATGLPFDVLNTFGSQIVYPPATPISAITMTGTSAEYLEAPNASTMNTLYANPAWNDPSNPIISNDIFKVKVRSANWATFTAPLIAKWDGTTAGSYIFYADNGILKVQYVENSANTILTFAAGTSLSALTNNQDYWLTGSVRYRLVGTGGLTGQRIITFSYSNDNSLFTSLGGGDSTTFGTNPATSIGIKPSGLPVRVGKSIAGPVTGLTGIVYDAWVDHLHSNVADQAGMAPSASPFHIVHFDATRMNNITHQASNGTTDSFSNELWTWYPLPIFPSTPILVSSSTPSLGQTASQNVGDVVYWYEYPDTSNNRDEFSGIARSSIQKATPDFAIPQYTFGSAFPVTEDGLPGATPSGNIINWKPPKWYAIDRYTQYQMGLLGKNYYTASATPVYPEYKQT